MSQLNQANAEFVPQAIVKLPVRDALALFEQHIAHGHDDLDEYDGADFVLNGELLVTVRHYRGHPDGTTTIYIDRRETDADRITVLVGQILEELKIPSKSLQWERRQNPEL